MLERGRTTILSQLIGDRSNISALDEALVSEFESLLDQINAPLPSPHNNAHFEQAQQRRRDSEAAFNLFVQKIRNIPGYDRFLLGFTLDGMRACASEGPIIVVNVTNIGSHAIIIMSSDIKSLELPELSPTEARRWLKRAWHTSPRSLESNNRDFREYLAWLWQGCVREVLIECGFRVRQPGTELPRIWWIGTGLASSMPFHAAGDHSSRPQKNLFNRAISSYTPSIKALAYSRERSQKTCAQAETVLLATMTVTPDLGVLHNVEDEKKVILESLPARYLAEEQDHPCASDILQSIQHCSIAHFACHGLSDYIDPSKSGLVFRKVDDAGRLVQDVMSVHAVSDLKLQRARLAYLSACSTAENGAARLQDEVIHVVSGFQVAGFAHVVGCLWPSRDAVCVQVAARFYGDLFSRGAVLGDRDIVTALHVAVTEARESYFDQPLLWAQFVHYGA